MKTPDLKPCPFCGSTKLKIESKHKLAGYNGLDMRVENRTFSVRCNVCHARGGAVGGKVILGRLVNLELPDYATTENVIVEKAIEAWNRRVTDENA